MSELVIALCDAAEWVKVVVVVSTLVLTGIEVRPGRIVFVSVMAEEIAVDAVGSAVLSQDVPYIEVLIGIELRPLTILSEAIPAADVSVGVAEATGLEPSPCVMLFTGTIVLDTTADSSGAFD